MNGATIKEVIELFFSNNIGKTDFQLRQVTPSNNINVSTKVLTVYSEIIKLLTANQIKFYTYTPKSLKRRTLILKGIKGDFNCADVKNALNELQIPNVEIIKVQDIVFKTRKHTSHHHLVQVSHWSNTAVLMKVKGILFQKARWEFLRKKIIFQCRNCQKLGHSQANCKLQQKCVKCGETHDKYMCTIKPEDTKEALKCANCN
ncbi:Protein of unknown function [Cotesia congregata]|uniref:Uncharacterized protein n=1 Tax=Cotesia congregata TaxID=51543 RepID=A0A8J2H990_COTCN|nr:Protein of unknown function [Cotesia congregata]